MYKAELKLNSESGLHARPASMIVKETSKYKCDISFIKNEVSYNAKSIISVISMGAKKGDLIKIVAQGEDAEKALEKTLYILNRLD